MASELGARARPFARETIPIRICRGVRGGSAVTTSGAIVVLQICPAARSERGARNYGSVAIKHADRIPLRLEEVICALVVLVVF